MIDKLLAELAQMKSEKTQDEQKNESAADKPAPKTIKRKSTAKK